MLNWRDRSPSNKRTIKRRLRRKKLAENSPWKIQLKKFKTQPSLVKVASSLHARDSKLQSSLSADREQTLVTRPGLDQTKTSILEFRNGLKIKKERTRVAKGGEESLDRTTVAHFRKRPEYYAGRKTVERKLKTRKCP